MRTHCVCHHKRILSVFYAFLNQLMFIKFEKQLLSPDCRCFVGEILALLAPYSIPLFDNGIYINLNDNVLKVVEWWALFTLAGRGNDDAPEFPISINSNICAKVHGLYIYIYLYLSTMTISFMNKKRLQNNENEWETQQGDWLTNGIAGAGEVRCCCCRRCHCCCYYSWICVCINIYYINIGRIILCLIKG